MFSLFEALQIDRRRVQRLGLIVVTVSFTNLVALETGHSIGGRLLENRTEWIGDLAGNERTVPKILGETETEWS